MNRPVTIRTLAALAGIFGVILAACSSPIQSSTPAPDLSAATAASAASPTPTVTPAPTVVPALVLDPGVLKGVKLTFIHPWSGTAAQAIERITADFNDQNIWGIRVNLASAGSSGEEFDQVMQALAGDGLPQIAAVLPDHAAAWEKARQGVIVDLAPFVSDPEWGMKKDEIEDYRPQFWEQNLTDGRQTGIPAQRSLQVLVYNQTWAEELGYTSLPDSPVTFQEQVCAATHANLTDKNKDKVGTGGYIISNDPNTHLAWLSAFGFDLSGLSDQGGYQFEGPAAETSFTYLRQLFDKSCAWIARSSQPFDYFAARQTLAYAGSMTDLPAQESALELAENSDRWTALPFPGSAKNTALQTGLNYVILDSNPPEELAAWLFLRWLMLERNQVQMVQAASSLPLSQSAADGLKYYGELHPQWQAAAALWAGSEPAPVQPEWRKVRGVLEDAAWQLIQPTLQPIPEILRQLDITIPEVVE